MKKKNLTLIFMIVCALMVVNLFSADKKLKIDDLKYNGFGEILLIENGAKTGAYIYTDREYTIKELPEEMIGGHLIQTANDDKKLTEEDILTFSINIPATIYIVYDSRLKKIPSWLEKFEKIDPKVQTSDPESNLNTYKLELKKKGIYSFGANLSGDAIPETSDKITSYFIIIK